MTRRVVITGLGQVSAAGTSLDQFWQHVCQPSPDRLPRVVNGFDPRRFLSSKTLRRSAPFTVYSVAASRLALLDADIDPSVVDPRQGAVIVATVFGDLDSIGEQAALRDTEGDEAVSPNLLVRNCESVAAGTVSATFGWRGPSRVVIAACAGGTIALADAARLVATGRADVAIAGGTQCAMTQPVLASFQNLRVLSDVGAARPFDRRRDGLVLAEGAASLVLESLDDARSRGARIYAEYLGAGETNDAASLVNPSGPASYECVEDALNDAAVDPVDVAHVNAHGTGTLVNDAWEAATLHHVFGDRPPPVTSIKGGFGHTLGAAGAFDAVTAALSLHRGLIPPIGVEVEPDERLGLDLVVGSPRRIPGGPVISTSFGLGGHNAAVLLGPV